MPRWTSSGTERRATFSTTTTNANNAPPDVVASAVKPAAARACGGRAATRRWAASRAGRSLTRPRHRSPSSGSSGTARPTSARRRQQRQFGFHHGHKLARRKPAPCRRSRHDCRQVIEENARGALHNRQCLYRRISTGTGAAIPCLRSATAGHRAINKFARRHWVGIAVAGLLVLTLLGGLAATSYEARIAALQRDSALEANRRSLTQTAAARLQEGDVSGALKGSFSKHCSTWVPVIHTLRVSVDVFQEARAADLQILAITGHSDRVRSVAISPDGRRIATASFDDTARIWMPRPGSR